MKKGKGRGRGEEGEGEGEGEAMLLAKCFKLIVWQNYRFCL